MSGRNLKRKRERVHTRYGYYLKYPSLVILLFQFYSFFEVPSEYVDEVCSLNNLLKHKGRTLYIEVAREKKTNKSSAKIKKGARVINAKDLNLNRNIRDNKKRKGKK